jgi:hypothetical protein
MNAQPQWPDFADLATSKSPPALPDERHAELKADMREAKARLRAVLEALAAKYDISARDVSYAIDGYADDMLSDLVWGIERDLEQEADEAEALRASSP